MPALTATDLIWLCPWSTGRVFCISYHPSCIVTALGRLNVTAVYLHISTSQLMTLWHCTTVAAAAVLFNTSVLRPFFPDEPNVTWFPVESSFCFGREPVLISGMEIYGPTILSAAQPSESQHGRHLLLFILLLVIFNTPT